MKKYEKRKGVKLASLYRTLWTNEGENLFSFANLQFFNNFSSLL